MDENKRGSFGSTIGFLLSAIGSAVGLGNIWGFPYKMGRCGGFTFLIVYLALAAFVGFAIMLSELAIGRSTGFGPVNAYKKISKKFKWIGWLAIVAPFLIMTFYSVLGGYCIYYMIINVAISGSVQYQVGMQNAKCIVSINHNAASPIFDISHYGAVADFKAVLPAVIAEIKNRRA